MAKASLKLPDGTSVLIEGTAEEVARLLATVGGATTAQQNKPKKARKPRTGNDKGKKVEGTDGPDLNEIVNLIKSCDEAEAIEKQILDKAGLVNRSLLPLYIIHEHFNNKFGLTTGEISAVTADLGVKISTPNVSTTLSKTASRYVQGDRLRKRGQIVRYLLSRKGVQYLKGVLSGE
ncbi:MAG: hypothetical protein RIB59_05995 [Rhodospirillales bacterium]